MLEFREKSATLIEVAFNGLCGLPFNGGRFQSIFFSININYTLNRRYNKYSSLFDIYLTK